MKFLEKHKQKIINVFIVFMILQPVFDIYYLYTDNIISIFKFSPSTIIRMIIIGFMIFVAFLYSKNAGKYIHIVIISIIYFIYILFHHFNSISFNIPFNLLNGYSIFGEVFYIIRMIIPLGLLYVTYQFKISWKQVKKIILYSALIFGIVMVITNIFKVAITSYYDGNKIIKANIFEWFNSNIYSKYSYINIASKGIFHMANQVSAVLLCILPILSYIYFEKRNFISYISILLLVISMLMLGTRVASYGWIFVLIVMLIGYLFFTILKRKKIDYKGIGLYVLIIVMGLIILPYSPVSNRYYIEDQNETINKNLTVSKIDKEYTKFMKYIKNKETQKLDEKQLKELKKEKQKFVKNYYNSFGIYPVFINEIYPYTEDVDFWLQEFAIPFSQRANHRELKQDITKRVVELNNKKSDYLFGVSFTRLRNAKIYMENDIYVHLYSIGIFGILLFIFPYFVVLIYYLYSMIKNNDNFNYLNITLVFSILLVFASAIVSGNVFDEWIVTFYLALICGMLINNIKINKNKKVLFISSTGGHLSELLQLKPLFKKYNSHLITEKTKSTIDLKNKFDKVNYLIYGTKDHKFSYIFKFGYNCIKSLCLFIKIRPKVIVTTGTHTAVPMCYFGKLFGSKIIFIETFANSNTKTLAGRMVYPIADTFIVQWKSMLDLYPEAIYGGWIY